MIEDALGRCIDERTCLKCQRHEKWVRGKNMKLFTAEIVEPGSPEKPCYEPAAAKKARAAFAAFTKLVI